MDFEKVCILFDLNNLREFSFQIYDKAAKPATPLDCISDYIQICIQPFKQDLLSNYQNLALEFGNSPK